MLTGGQLIRHAKDQVDLEISSYIPSWQFFSEIEEAVDVLIKWRKAEQFGASLVKPGFVMLHFIKSAI